MSSDVCGLFIPRELESNSAALLYSINMATKKNKDDSLSVDLKKAGKIYKFIKENVTLPELKPDHTTDFYQKEIELFETLNQHLQILNQAGRKPDAVTEGS